MASRSNDPALRALDQMVRDVFADLNNGLAQSDPIGEAAHLARRMLIDRTRSGIDRFGNPFADYAPTTARRKGRTAPVTLSETNAMLDNITVESTGTLPGLVRRDLVPDARGRRLLRLHISGTRRMPSRDPWGLTQPEGTALARHVRIYTQRVIPKDRRRRVTLTLFSDSPR